MIKALENIEDKSKFEQALISLILGANTENLEKLRIAYPELVKEYRE